MRQGCKITFKSLKSHMGMFFKKQENKWVELDFKQFFFALLFPL